MYEIIKNKIPIIFYVFSFVLIYILSRPGITKYYIALVIAICVWIKIKMKLKKTHVLLALPALFYAGYGSILAMMQNTISFNTFKEISLFIAPIMLAIPLQQYFTKRGIRLSEINFWMLIPVFLIQNVPTFDPENLLESMYSFIFAFYAVYYCYKRKFNLFILATILSYLGHKRIGTVALILGIIMVTVFYSKIKNNIQFNIVFFILLIVSIFVLIYLIENNFMNELMVHGIHPMGRDAIYNRFRGQYDFNLFYFGRGVGYVYNVLYAIVIPGQANMHCDWLHIYIEIGFLGTLIYLGLYLFFILQEKKNNMGIITQLLAVVFICGFTDNVAVYILTLYPLYVLLLDITYFGVETKESHVRVRIKVF